MTAKVYDLKAYTDGYNHGINVCGFEAPCNSPEYFSYEKGYARGYMEAIRRHNAIKALRGETD